jgi:hypothetical protein
MAACPRCGGPWLRSGTRCPRCGALDGELAVEPVGGDSGTTTRGEVDLGRRPPRRRTAAVVGAVIVAVGAVAVAVGHGGGNGTEPLTAPTTTTPPTTVTRTTRPPATTTTTTTLPNSYAATLTARLSEATGGTVLYGVDDAGGMLLRIDLDAGRVEARRFTTPRSDAEPLSVMGVSGGALVLPLYSNDLGWLVPDDLGASIQDVSQQQGLLLPTDDPSRVWRLDGTYYYPSGDDDRTATVVDVPGLLGRPSRPLAAQPLPATAIPLGDDRHGRLLLVTLDGTFTLDPVTGAVQRIGSGPALAWSAQHLLMASCDDALACRFRLLDRSNGQVVDGGPVPLDIPLWGEVPLGLLDPTGRFLARFDGTSMQIVGLADGSLRRFLATTLTGGGQIGRSPFAWSVDGRWLFWPDGDARLAAWHDGLEDPEVIAVDGASRLQAIAVAPTSTGP